MAHLKLVAQQRIKAQQPLIRTKAKHKQHKS